MILNGFFALETSRNKETEETMNNQTKCTGK